MKTDPTKYELLEYLKQQEVPGPFTKPQEVVKFVEDEDSKEKVERMGKEVHYAKLMCTNMKHSSLFSLTRNGRSLPSHEYGDNLREYLDTARCLKNLTVNDLNNVLHG